MNTKKKPTLNKIAEILSRPIIKAPKDFAIATIDRLKRRWMEETNKKRQHIPNEIR